MTFFITNKSIKNNICYNNFNIYLCSFEAEGLTLIKKTVVIDFSQLQGPGRSLAQNKSYETSLSILLLYSKVFSKK